MNGPFEPVLSIIIPCYNEEANIGELVRRTITALALHDLHAEILLVDDGSGDGTRGAIEAIARRRPEVRLLVHENNRGIVAAWSTGLAGARAPCIAITDADLQYAPEDIPRLYRLFVEGDADLVQGWRIAHDFQDTYRYLLSVTFSFLLNRLFGTRLRDIKSGFLCTRKEVFRAMLETRYRYRHLQHFIVVNAASQGFRIRQEPVIFRKRQAGQSFITSPFRFGLASLTDLPRAFWEFRVLNRRKATR